MKPPAFAQKTYAFMFLPKLECIFVALWRKNIEEALLLIDINYFCQIIASCQQSIKIKFVLCALEVCIKSWSNIIQLYYVNVQVSFRKFIKITTKLIM